LLPIGERHADANALADADFEGDPYVVDSEGLKAAVAGRDGSSAAGAGGGASGSSVTRPRLGTLGRHSAGATSSDVGSETAGEDENNVEFNARRPECVSPIFWDSTCVPVTEVGVPIIAEIVKAGDNDDAITLQGLREVCRRCLCVVSTCVLTAAVCVP
jgi:hypothetical protein